MIEQKNKRGRPATGRKRDKQVKFNLTQDELNKLKQYLLDNNLTIHELILNTIK